MKKKILSFLVAALMITTTISPAAVYASEPTEETEECPKGGEHAISDWFQMQATGLAPSESIYPNPPDLDTTYDITVARVCTKCGEVLETAEESKVIHAPTCQEDGYTWYKDRNGKETTSDIIKADPKYHGFGPLESQGVTTETKEDGTIIQKEEFATMCVFCHEKKVAATETKTTKPATCTEGGYEEFTSLEGITTHTDIPAPGHQWGKTSNPVVKTEGEKTTETTYAICENCGEMKTHTHSVWHVPATCTETGKWYESEHDTEWTMGGEIQVTKEEEATGHKWSAWETSVNPTTETEGEKVRECSVCHEKETEMLPKLKKETSDENAIKNQNTVTPTNQNTVKQTGTTAKNISVKKIKLNKKKVTLKKGKTFKIKATVFPKNATNKKVTYKSSNKKVATVSKSGKIKAKKKGKCTITIASKDGKKKAKIKVTVK